LAVAKLSTFVIYPKTKVLIMKKLIGISLFLLLAHLGQAQQTEGHVVYETKINVHRMIPKEGEAMKAQIPEFRTAKNELYFNANESLYQPYVDEEEDVAATSGGGMMMMRGAAGKTHLNFPATVRTEQREVMGKEYLIVDTLRTLPWKFSEETKQIKGYTCKKATMTREERNRSQNVTVWYTDAVFVTAGPDKFYGLPGLVLAVDVNDGEIVISPIDIQLKPLKKNDIKTPTSGKKVTDAEFREAMREQMKGMAGPGGAVIRN
jgi:GLPGLI family protein